MGLEQGPSQAGDHDVASLTERRRGQLRRLRDERFGGKNSRLAEAVGRARSYISRVLNDKKGIAEQFCRDVEQRLKLPAYWMDGLSDEQGPAKPTTQRIDPDMLMRSMQVVDRYVAAKRSSSLTELQRAMFISNVYSTFFDQDVSADGMLLIMERWTELTGDNFPR